MTENKTKDKNINSISNVDRIIHEPARLMIMAYLYIVEEADFLFLIRQTNLTWGNLSSHITKLEEAGYLKVKKEFLNKKPHTILFLTKEGRSAFKDYREKIKQVIDKLPD